MSIIAVGQFEWSLVKIPTLADNIAHSIENQKSNKIIQFKFSYGRYHEPIAIKHCERYTKLKGHKTVVKPYGLAISSENFTLGTTPDGKVVFNEEFRIIKVKYSEKYSNLYPKDILFLKRFVFFLLMVTIKSRLIKSIHI